MVRYPNLTPEEIQERFDECSGDCPIIDRDKLVESIKSLPRNKAYCALKIPNETLLFGGDVLIDILVNVFQAMYKFGFVSKSFGESYISPTNLLMVNGSNVITVNKFALNIIII